MIGMAQSLPQRVAARIAAMHMIADCVIHVLVQLDMEVFAQDLHRAFTMSWEAMPRVKVRFTEVMEHPCKYKVLAPILLQQLFVGQKEVGNSKRVISQASIVMMMGVTTSVEERSQRKNLSDSRKVLILRVFKNLHDSDFCRVWIRHMRYDF